MARIRSVKPEFWTDRKLARLTRDARLLYISMWNQSDEHGRLHGDARYVKGHCLPYDDDLGLDDIDALLNELQAFGRVLRYEVEGDPYLFLPHLARHQRLEAHKQESRLPPPPSHPARVSTSPRDSEDSPEKSAQSPDNLAEPANEAGEIVAQQVAGSRWQVAGSRGAASPAADPAAATLEGTKILAAYSKRHGALPRQVQRRLGEQIDSLLADGITPPQVCQALDAWTAKPDAAPGLLPHLVKTAPRQLDPHKAYLTEQA
jgi:hypothetical protein